jgi:hypothetical protein
MSEILEIDDEEDDILTIHSGELAVDDFERQLEAQRFARLAWWQPEKIHGRVTHCQNRLAPRKGLVVCIVIGVGMVAFVIFLHYRRHYQLHRNWQNDAHTRWQES